MAILYITSDVASAGKTALAGALATQLAQSGKTVGYFKPFSATPEDDQDVRFIAGELLSDQNGQEPMVPQPIPEDPLTKKAAAELARSVEALRAAKDMVLVEGPSLAGQDGGPESISEGLTDALDAPVLIIVQYRRDLEVDQIAEMCRPFGQRVLGILINSVTKFKRDEVLTNLGPGIESRGLKLLGALSEDRRMLAATLKQIAGQLDARWVTDHGKDEELVESFLIGGNIMDSGATYFGRRDNQLVIVRGDRPDIQLAALSTPTAALVLTGGHEPIEYVYHQAEQENTPVLVVQNNTLETAAALNSMLELAEIHHLLKLERFAGMLREQADLAAIETL